MYNTKKPKLSVGDIVQLAEDSLAGTGIPSGSLFFVSSIYPVYEDIYEITCQGRYFAVHKNYITLYAREMDTKVEWDEFYKNTGVEIRK